MNALLSQLELDQSFFVELAIFAGLFFFLSKFYFKPFLKLFEARHKKTIEDRESAEKLLEQANAKLEEYKRVLAEERAAARREIEHALQEARKQEAKLVAEAREEAKKITQEAVHSVSRQRDQLKKQLEADVESMAQAVSEKLLSRKV